MKRDPQDWHDSSMILPGTIALVVILVFPILVFGGTFLLDKIWAVLH